MRVDEVFSHDFVEIRQTKLTESIKEILSEAPEDRKGGVAFEKKLEKFIMKRGRATATIPNIWQAPAASDAVWPDLGASIVLPSGTEVHLHIEAKAGPRDPMGSLRSWIFDSKGFRVDPRDGSPVAGGTQIILSVMNNNKSIKANARKILKHLKTSFDPGVKEVSSGSLNIIPDKTKRLRAAIRFTKAMKKDFPGRGEKGTSGFQLGTLKDGEIGNLILAHYKKKFKPRPGGPNIMMFAVGPNQLFYMPTTKPSKALQRELAEFFGVDSIPFLPKNLEGALEVRGQVRGLSQVRGGAGSALKQPPAGFEAKKRVSIDVQANLKFSGLNKVNGAKF